MRVNDLTSDGRTESGISQFLFSDYSRSSQTRVYSLTSDGRTEGGKRKSKFQSEWDALYTHKSSCDLEIPIFFRYSYWLLLA